MRLGVRLGLFDPPGQPPDRRAALLLHGNAASVESAWPAVDAALRSRPAYRLIIAVPEADLDAVRRRLSHERVVAGPPATPLMRRIFDWRHGIVASVNAAEGQLVTDEVAASLLAVTPDTKRADQRLLPLALSAAGSHELPTLAALRQALGSPETILCLGNGPSSESPAVSAYAGATLFRVNWTWRERGMMASPDAVFTADPDLPPRGSRAILVFPRGGIARRVLLQHLMALRPARAGYLMLDRLRPQLTDLAAATIPTNGALMVAVAAALQPRRLVIAGLDLYRHPEGRYPGGAAIDGYARGHSAACDLALIGEALAGFSGEVVILSPALAEALGR
jgi:hypothetical protein